MKHPDLPLEGGCRCGRVRLRLSAPPLATFACHCTGCQRMSSSAYSLSAMVSAEGFEILSGETVRGGLREGAIHHFFCPDCMSWLFTRWEGMDGLVNIRPTILDDTSWFAPFIETYTSEKLPFAETGAPRSYPKFPDQAEFPVLLQAYAEAVAETRGAGA